MAETVDPKLFQDLAEQSPADVCKRALCRYDPTNKSYQLTVWGNDYTIYPDTRQINCTSRAVACKTHAFFDIFLINYLLQVQDTDLAGEWISEKDMPGGVTFFRGPHEIPTQPIASGYHSDLDAFKHWCETLGGVPFDMADAAYAFHITPRLSIAVLFWFGDEDFPPESKLLYDKTMAQHLTLDIIFSLAVDACYRIAQGCP